MPNNYICDICGQPLPSHSLIYQDGLILCRKCIELNGTCYTCEYSDECAFNLYSGPLPKTIIKTANSPMGVMRMEQRNPAVEQETCAKSCKCWNDTCNKTTYKTCTNYTYLKPQGRN